MIAIIPARSGSKSIPNKNIKNYSGKPLIAWTIEQAKNSKYINKVIVSTDSEEYKKIAEKYGAEVPFLRPSEISNDSSTDYEFMKHFVDYLNENQIKTSMIVHLRPTYPNRKTKDIDEAIELFQQNIYQFTSLRSVVETDFSAYKMYSINNNQLNPLFENVNNINEPYNNARQLLPKCYWHNGCIDITTSECIMKYKSVSGNKILPFIMNEKEIDDIDTITDWRNSEKKINNFDEDDNFTETYDCYFKNSL